MAIDKTSLKTTILTYAKTLKFANMFP